MSRRKPMNLQVDDAPMEQGLDRGGSFEINEDGMHFKQSNLAIGTQGIVDQNNGSLLRLEGSELQVFETLGRGASSYVQRAVHKATGTPLALKVINVHDRNKRHQLINDVKALVESECPSLVKFYGAYYEEGVVKVALEYMDVGSIADVIKKVRGHQEPCTPEPVISKMAAQMLQGLIYLHKVKHQIHRDIKPENILINSSGQVKLTDFGISRELQDTQGLCATFVGTVTYMSPERILGQTYNFSSDVWSLGLVLVELARGTYPYPPVKSYIEMVDNVCESPEPSLSPLVFSAELCDFVTRCLQKNPLTRASAIDLMGHPFITRYWDTDVDVTGWVRSVIM
eukprot:GILJ01004759.1.p1 GENE.GILJ01004759.1~~GILJ01004759.1.p1  ORF type:complete len:351 (+),score=44.11 GILJ01004759.1:32-1054(+)